MTLSPALSPSRMTHSLPIHRPATTGRTVASFFSLTIYTIFPRSDVCTATWGTRKTPSAFACNYARTHKLPRQKPLIRCCRMSRAIAAYPAAGSIWLAAKFSSPFFSYSVPSGSIRVTCCTLCSFSGPPSCASSLSDRLKRTHMGDSWTIVVRSWYWLPPAFPQKTGSGRIRRSPGRRRRYRRD